jgi:hypothetical protein
MCEDDMIQEIQVCNGTVWKVVPEEDGLSIFDDTGERVHRSKNWEMTAVHLALALAREKETLKFAAAVGCKNRNEDS